MSNFYLDAKNTDEVVVENTFNAVRDFLVDITG